MKNEISGYEFIEEVTGDGITYIFVFPARGHLEFKWVRQENGTFKCDNCDDQIDGRDPCNLQEIAFVCGYHLCQIDNTKFTFYNLRSSYEERG